MNEEKEEKKWLTREERQKMVMEICQDFTDCEEIGDKDLYDYIRAYKVNLKIDVFTATLKWFIFRQISRQIENWYAPNDMMNQGE